MGRHARRQQNRVERAWSLEPGRPALCPVTSLPPEHRRSEENSTDLTGLWGGLEVNETKATNPLIRTEHVTNVLAALARGPILLPFHDLPAPTDGHTLAAASDSACSL